MGLLRGFRKLIGRRTNIGTTVPPVAPMFSRPQQFKRVGLPVAQREGEAVGPRLIPNAPPVALPIAQREGEALLPKVIAPDPLWVSRWQNSATPVGQPRPWVTGYRWWVAGVHYSSGWYDPDSYRIDFMWRNHREAYMLIPYAVWQDFRLNTGSVGQWFHRNILVPGWKRGMGARYPSFPL